MTRFSKIILGASTLLLLAQVGSIIFIGNEAAVGHIIFLLFENLLMIAVTLIPALLGRTVNVRIPKAMEIAFVGFCFASLVMGDLFDFYGKYPWWDTVLHGISGIMLGILGYEIINVLIPADKVSPWFIAFWIMCFALAAGAIWEILEYIVDGIFGLNSQEFMMSSGTFDCDIAPRQGREALKDTMDDLLLDFIGAFGISVATVIHLRKQQKLTKDF